MDESIIVAIITSGGVGTIVSFITYLISRHDKKVEQAKEKNSAMARMLLAIGHDRIVFLTAKYIDRGAITVGERANLEQLYEPYHDMGGNGDGKSGFEACKALEIISDNEAKARDLEIRRKEFAT